VHEDANAMMRVPTSLILLLFHSVETGNGATKLITDTNPEGIKLEWRKSLDKTRHIFAYNLDGERQT
jgi:hypothetical protein